MPVGRAKRLLAPDLAFRLRRALPPPLVAVFRRALDVSLGVADEARWHRIRRRLAREGLSGGGAVIVHIHYADTWPDIAARIQACVPEVPVVVTTSGSVDSGEVRAALPQAHVYRVPNRGRDVLPFLQVVRALGASGFSWFLKLHGKKSHHHRFGAEWMASSLDALLPSASVALECVDQLTEGTPLIGPHGFFYSLSTHWEPNQERLEALTGPLDAASYGFFGGTMWWVRPDTLSALPRWRSWDFPKERGQTDGTTAHIFERLVCVLPQLRGLQLSSVDRDGVRTVTAFDAFPYHKL